MKPLELKKNKKYRNIEHLIATAQLNLFDSATIDKIDNSENATIYYLLIQFKINKLHINDLCEKYVYDNDPENSQLNDLIKLKDKIINKHRLITEMLDIPIDLTRDRLKKHLMILSSGYHTYGDFESSLSFYLAPFLTLDSFSNMLNASRELIENIGKRIKLTDYLKIELDSHYKKIELELTENQKLK